MSTPFDPYYKWLGISPDQPPPHYYRLLGVQPFESDAEVISNAADQRMALLKTFAAGVHGMLAEELLSKVARARVCLLNPAKKCAYDDSLRITLNTAPMQAQVRPGFWIPPVNGILHALDVTCAHCDEAFVYGLASQPQITKCKQCNNEMLLPRWEEVANAAALLTQKPTPMGNKTLSDRSEGSISGLSARGKNAKIGYDATTGAQDRPQTAPFADPPLTPSIAVVGNAAHYRKRSRRSPIVTFAGMIVGGVFGLSAGYFMLCVMDIRFDFLHLINVNKPSEPHQTVIREPPKILERRSTA